MLKNNEIQYFLIYFNIFLKTLCMKFIINLYDKFKVVNEYIVNVYFLLPNKIYTYKIGIICAKGLYKFIFGEQTSHYLILWHVCSHFMFRAWHKQGQLNHRQNCR